MIDLFFVILLAVVQGITEFLPVSSTGHLIILEKLFNLSSTKFGLSFDVALHLGTFFALVIYFREKLIRLIQEFIKGETRFGLLIIFGTIPALVIGAILESFIRDAFRSPFFVALNLIIFSFIFLLAERIGKNTSDFNKLSFFDSLFIGFFQAIALLPGVSRSGITIAGGFLRNLKKEQAGEFAFLLSIPIVLVAFGKDMVSLILEGFPVQYFLNFIVGAFVSFIVGLVCIYYFLSYLKKHGLLPFIIYRILLAVFIIVFFLRPTNLPSAQENTRQDIVKTDETTKTSFGLTYPMEFELSIYAQNLGDPRVLKFDEEGTLLASIPGKGEIVALIDKNKDGIVDEQKVVVSNLDRPHGFDFNQGYLYVADVAKLRRFIYDSKEKKPSKGEIIASLPSGGRHTTRYIEFGKDGRLYISSGSTCDVCSEKDPRNGSIFTLSKEGKDEKIFATGLRNSVFFTFHPQTDEIYATEMGRDWLGDNLPPDEVNIIKENNNYGWPFCYGNKIHDRQFDNSNTKSDFCTKTITPFIELPAHVAPLGIAFFEGDLLVSLHGSWNSSEPVGYKVVRINLNKNNELDDFLTGFLKDGEVIGRPAGIVVSNSGDIYISDDKAGKIYKLTKNPIR